MKRHERPYGCTFLTCNKTFGSKNDWKRHENSQHFQLETWRCDIEKPEGGVCAKVSYRRQTFQEHLKIQHAMSDPDVIKIKGEACRIGRNCQARFWCGFCKKLIDLKKKGLDAWIERFDHIDDHFMGRKGMKKQSIRNWIPVDGDKPKGGIASPNSFGGNSPKHGHDEVSGDSISESVENQTSTSKKREHSDDENERPRKYSKRTEIVYCVSFISRESMLLFAWLTDIFSVNVKMTRAELLL